MFLRHLLIIGAIGSLLVGCGLSGPSRHETSVRGRVSDTAFRPVPGTRVEILDGPRAGASMSTGANGQFEFGGSARGAVRLRAAVTASRARRSPQCGGQTPVGFLFI